MLRRLNLTIALLSILGFANSAFASVYQTVDLSNSINPVQFTYTAQNGLKVGLNCIRVRVNNEGGPTGLAVQATLQGYGAQDTALEGCCRRSAPHVYGSFRSSSTELDPRRKR